MTLAGKAVAGAALMLLSAVGITSVPAAPPPLDRGAVTVSVGDTLVPLYAVRTDTVIKVTTTHDASGAPHDVVVANACGPSMVFAGWAKRVNGVVGSPIVRDSVTLTVTGCALRTASVGVCFLDVAVAESLHIAGDTTIDPKLIPAGACKP